MSNVILDISRGMGLPVRDVENAFLELKRKGFVYTSASTSSQFFSKKHAYRIFGHAPAGLLTASEVSFGPFPVDREHYERLRANIVEPDVFRVLLGLYRLSYEKTGMIINGYRFQAPEEALDRYLMLMDMWDVFDPVIFDTLVWIVPNDKAKQAVQATMKKKFAKNDFRWWNIRFDLGEEFKCSALEEYPDEYFLLPDEFMHSWGRYLPSLAYSSLLHVYHRMAAGGTFDTLHNLDDILGLLREAIAANSREHDISISDIDKELLVKELCDINSLPYPVDETTLFQYLHQIGIFRIDQSQNRIDYSLTQERVYPNKVLKVPGQWEEKMNDYLSSGSILFSYLTMEEIVNDNIIEN